mmetsp:Transcript_27028/g.62864  ORF Transcript_27028/g.62864 Transcript_27028/m.62864 type:complete len:205 (-) Transcript_27028:383-997(-)
MPQWQLASYLILSTRSQTRSRRTSTTTLWGNLQLQLPSQRWQHQLRLLQARLCRRTLQKPNVVRKLRLLQPERVLRRKKGSARGSCNDKRSWKKRGNGEKLSRSSCARSVKRRRGDEEKKMRRERRRGVRSEKRRSARGSEKGKMLSESGAGEKRKLARWSRLSESASFGRRSVKDFARMPNGSGSERWPSVKGELLSVDVKQT